MTGEEEEEDCSIGRLSGKKKAGAGLAFSG